MITDMQVYEANLPSHGCTLVTQYSENDLRQSKAGAPTNTFFLAAAWEVDAAFTS